MNIATHKQNRKAFWIVLWATIASGLPVACHDDWRCVDIVPERSWHGAQLVGIGQDPEVAIDARGNGMSVWLDSGIVWAGHFSKPTGWDEPQQIGDGTAGNSSPLFAFDAAGNGFAIWQHANEILANRYNHLTGWEGAQPIETNITQDMLICGLQFAMDAAGNGLVVWRSHSESASRGIWSARYTPDGGWSAAQFIGTVNIARGCNLALAMNSNGSAMAIWDQSDTGDRVAIQSAYYTTDGGWGQANSIIGGSALVIYSLQLAVDGYGNAIAAWKFPQYWWTSLATSRYTPMNGWSSHSVVAMNTRKNQSIKDSPILPYPPYPLISSPHIAMDANGNALLVWALSYSYISPFNIWSRHYSPSVGWEASVKIEESEEPQNSPQVAMDASGNGLALWEQSDSIWSSYYRSGQGWEKAQLVEFNEERASSPQIVMNADGNGLAMWQQSNEIWANSYEEDFPIVFGSLDTRLDSFEVRECNN